MTLFEQLIFELLQEDNTNPTQRLKNATPEQASEIKAIKSELKDFLEKNGVRIGSPRHGEDFRLQVQNSPVDANWIDVTLKNMGHNYTLKEIPGGEPDAKSRSLPTVRITTASGGNIYIVLSGLGKKSNRKQFAPNKFKIEGKEYKHTELYKELQEKIGKKKYDEKIKEYLLDLLATAEHGDITYSGDTYTVTKVVDDVEIDKADKNNIQNDFGEILGALVIAREEDEVIHFPAASNEPLVDYEVGNYRYSAKSLGGAAPTLTALADKYYNYVKNEMDYPGDRNVLAEMFEYIRDRNLNTEQSYLAITKAVSEDGWQAFTDFMGDTRIKPEDSNVIDRIKEKLDEYYEMGTLEENLNALYDRLSTVPRTPISKFDTTARWRSGYVTSALSYYLPKVLNANVHGVKDALKMVINQMDDVKQVNFYNDNDKFRFKITEFVSDDISIKFEGGGSVTMPGDKKLRFKIKT